MADEVKPEAPAPDVSPTGAPLVSPRLAPYFAAAAAICTVVAGASKIPGLHMPDEVFGYAALLALIFGTLLGTTPGLRSKAPMLLLVLSLGMSCSSATPLIISGETLKEAQIEYHTAVDLMQQSMDAGIITKEQFHTWRVFSDYFAASYDLAVQSWQLARQVDDAVREQRLLVDIQDLLDKLRHITAPIVVMFALSRDGGS